MLTHISPVPRMKTELSRIGGKMDELFFNSYGEKEAIKCVWIMCLGERV
jgi:hypothetical protein